VISVRLDIREGWTDTFRIHKAPKRLEPEDPTGNFHQTNYRLDPVLSSLRRAGACPGINQKLLQVESTLIPNFPVLPAP
jgi:hypothetical protein